MARASREEPVRIDRRERKAAVEFCRGLARTLGDTFRVALYDLDPPRLVESWGPRVVRPEDPIPALVSEAGGSQILNRPVGRARVSVLPLPWSRPSRFAVVIEANTAAFARVASAMASLIDPDAAAVRTERHAHVGDALERLLLESEARLGVPLAQMSRSQKQEVVKFLDERGAFLLKKAVEQVAGRLGVSRFTIYNYLDEVKREE